MLSFRVAASNALVNYTVNMEDKIVFSKEEDEILSALVDNIKVVYDNTSYHLKTGSFRSTIWNNIAEEVGRPSMYWKYNCEIFWIARCKLYFTILRSPRERKWAVSSPRISHRRTISTPTAVIRLFTTVHLVVEVKLRNLRVISFACAADLRSLGERSILIIYYLSSLHILIVQVMNVRSDGE